MDNEPPTQDAVLRALADPARRRIVAYLREHGDATRLELADVVTGWLAADRDSGAADPTDWERVRVALRHAHLPSLADAGLVETDADTATVALAALPPWVDACLDAVLAADRDARQPRDAEPDAT